MVMSEGIASRLKEIFGNFLHINGELFIVPVEERLGG